MARSFYKEIEKDGLPGYVFEGPFYPFYAGEDQFLVQCRPKGEPFGEMHTSVLKVFAEKILQEKDNAQR